jgi:glycosyltransferase involved in cell wall biosynthesis
MPETNTTLPKITLIIGVLNMRKHLAATLDSVIQQHYKNLELIVMDGGSTDGTLDIIQQYTSSITLWKSAPDNGHADACNKAIEIATGDYIALLNADDLLAPGLLDKVAQTARSYPGTKVITCGVDIISKDNMGRETLLQRITAPSQLQISLKNMLFALPVINARFIHRDIYRQFGGFQATHPDGSYNLSNDRDFLVRLALAGIQSVIIDEPLYIYLSHAESLTFSNKNHVKTHLEHLRLSRKFLALPMLTPAQTRLVKAWYLRESVFLALIYLSRFKLKDFIATSRNGVKECGLFWIVKFFLQGFKAILKKIDPYLYPDNGLRDMQPS